jgi:hypothetical protein
MYDVLRGIKDGEIASTRSAPDFKTFREHYRKVSGRSKVSAIREDNCLKHWEKFLRADLEPIAEAVGIAHLQIIRTFRRYQSRQFQLNSTAGEPPLFG